VSELADALAEPLPTGPIDLVVTSGGDDTIDEFDARAPRVVVLTATLEVGDAKSLIETLRDMVSRDRMVIVLVGDDDGPIRTALDAIDMKPDRFVSRPLAAKALRFAVQSGLETVARAIGTAPPVDDVADANEPVVSRVATPVRGSGPQMHVGSNGDASAPVEKVAVSRAGTDRGVGIALVGPAVESAPETTESKRTALRARWEAIADSIGDDNLADVDDLDDADGDLIEEELDDAPPLPAIEIGPRKKGSTNPEFLPLTPVAPWRPGTTNAMQEEEIAPTREPTLILHDEVQASPMPSLVTQSPLGTSTAPGLGGEDVPRPPAAPAAASGPRSSPAEDLASRERWSKPVLLSQLIDRSRDSSRELLATVRDAGDLGNVDEVDDDIIVGHPQSTPPPHVLRGGGLQALEDLIEAEPPPDVPRQTPQPEPEPTPNDRPGGGRDFARQLRAKMSMMAQRLFQSESPAQPSVDIRPLHDHHTEIDLAALGEEPALGGGVTEIESRGRAALGDPPSIQTSPGSWDTQVRERGLPESGEVVRGVSDAAMILAKMFAQSFTGRVGFRKDGAEKIVYFDAGRPVFASSNEPGDRMGELLVREGKITASQYERCQIHVAQSGRRMGEILVDFGYLKRRELLPAVRRHVEDVLYSLFGWDHGIYRITEETTASAERIRLSRHPASLVMEGIRRKLGRTTLEKLLGASSTVIEVPDRERLGGIINTGDLAVEERAALTAFDGQADLAQVARTIGVDVADVLPFAWGLCVLGLATARRTEADPAEESTALVGETDLAIDRERVRARWQLVSEADYFALLGVRRDATAFEIRRAYQAARRDFAADCFPQDLRRELARELDDISTVLDEAFRVLRDDRLRLTYLSNLIE
jgi:hypothetical protein